MAKKKRELQGVTAYLTFENCADAIEFYRDAFGATEITRFEGPDGRIVHAEIEVGGTRLFMCDNSPRIETESVETRRASPVAFYYYVPDVDDAIERALEAGAEMVAPAEDVFWGDRIGMVADPFGFRWTLATRQGNVSLGEIKDAIKA